MNKILLFAPLLAAVAMSAVVAADPYAELPGYTLGGTLTAPAAIESEIRSAGPAGYATIETRLLAAMAKPEATYDCKKFVCETLRMIGSAACVDPMVGLLADEKTEDPARIALQSLPDKAVDEKLLAALEHSASRVRLGLIQTLAARHCGGLVSVLKNYLASGDIELSKASLRALGKVGGPVPVDVLIEAKVVADLQPVREEALMDAAFALGDREKAATVFDTQFHSGSSLPAVIIAMNGLIECRGTVATAVLRSALTDSRAPLALAATRAAVRVASPDVTRLLCDALPTAPEAVQVAIVRALHERGDASARPALMAALSGGTTPVKAQAIVALQELGDAACVSELVTIACQQGELAAIASQTLGVLNAPGVDEALLALLDDSDAARMRVAAMAFRARDNRSIVPRLVNLAESKTPEIRTAALESLQGLAGEKDMPVLMGMLSESRTPGDLGMIATALWKTTRAMGSNDQRFLRLWQQVSGSPEAVRRAVLPLAATSGEPESLKIVADLLARGSEPLRDQAARTLFSWPNAAGLSPLVELIRTTNQPRYKILAARSVVRLVSDKRSGLRPQQKIDTLQTVLPLVVRPEDKKMIESAITQLRTGGPK
jgi:HEAT repeat protein